MDSVFRNVEDVDWAGPLHVRSGGEKESREAGRVKELGRRRDIWFSPKRASRSPTYRSLGLADSSGDQSTYCTLSSGPWTRRLETRVDLCGVPNNKWIRRLTNLESHDIPQDRRTAGQELVQDQKFQGRNLRNPTMKLPHWNSGILRVHWFVQSGEMDGYGRFTDEMSHTCLYHSMTSHSRSCPIDGGIVRLVGIRCRIGQPLIMQICH